MSDSYLEKWEKQLIEEAKEEGRKEVRLEYIEANLEIAKANLEIAKAKYETAQSNALLMEVTLNLLEHGEVNQDTFDKIVEVTSKF